MTTAMTDIADLVKILREQPEWAETLRAVLLTKELLELPEKLAQLTARFEEFVTLQTETNQRVAEQLARLTEQVTRLTEQQAQLTARLEEFIAEQRETNRIVAERLARLEADTAELKATTGRLEADTAELKATTGRLETDMSELKATTGRLETDVAELKSDMTGVKATTGRLETDVAELKSDTAELKSDTAELKADTAELKADTAELKSDMTGVKATTGRQAGSLGRLEGADLERKIQANIAAMLGDRPEFRHPRVLKSIVVPAGSELFDILYPALDAGRIDRRQFRSLLRADIILSVRDANARFSYVVIEISRTVHDDDLTRARERADILAAASAAPAVALAIGQVIPPPQRRKAQELAVMLEVEEGDEDTD